MATRVVFGAFLAAALSTGFVAISCQDASAQDAPTCSQARSYCGKQRICQKRYDACMQTGCWTVGPL